MKWKTSAGNTHKKKERRRVTKRKTFHLMLFLFSLFLCVFKMSYCSRLIQSFLCTSFKLKWKIKKKFNNRLFMLILLFSSIFPLFTCSDANRFGSLLFPWTLNWIYDRFALSTPERHFILKRKQKKWLKANLNSF